MADIEGNGKGDKSQYEALLEELEEKGVLEDGGKIAEEGGIHPFAIDNHQRQSNASLLASVPNAERYFEGDEEEKKYEVKQKGLLLDLLNRTRFRNDKECKYFLDWVSWCEEFGVGLAGPIRYIVAVCSIEGMARDQYRDAITTWRLRQYGHGGTGNKDKPKSDTRALS